MQFHWVGRNKMAATGNKNFQHNPLRSTYKFTIHSHSITSTKLPIPHPWFQQLYYLHLTCQERNLQFSAGKTFHYFIFTTFSLSLSLSEFFSPVSWVVPSINFFIIENLSLNSRPQTFSVWAENKIQVKIKQIHGNLFSRYFISPSGGISPVGSISSFLRQWCALLLTSN